MWIEKIKIKNFKCYGEKFETTLAKGVNIIVGNNEAGKSTLVEAIQLALTGTLNGRYVKNELSSYLFNVVAEREYIESLKTSEPKQPPEIAIELFLAGDEGELPELARLEGNDNSEKIKASGVSYRIRFDDDRSQEYWDLIAMGDLKSIPIEYYKLNWQSFARQEITARSIPLKSAFIDSSGSRLQNGSDIYISRIIRENLEDKERASISQAHRQMREGFMADENVRKINDKINTSARITRKPVTISVDLSSQSAWESSLMTYIADIPFQYIGKGEQCIVKTKLALSSKRHAEATVLLIEEPENHLSHSKLNEFIADIKANNGDKQIVMTTHSSFVANKLGLENLLLLRNSQVIRLNQLEASDFFKKLAGYDTLRLVLSAKSILVEGDSDELVVQRAYMDANDGKLPIEMDIDVISVGTSFLRFLELAKLLKITVAVVTDNDGDVDAVRKKYEDYSAIDHINICYDPIVDSGNLKIGDKPFNYNTLEPKILKKNGRDTLNKVLKTEFKNDDDLHRHMRTNKTNCALAIFESKDTLTFPDYICNAIKI